LAYEIDEKPEMAGKLNIENTSHFIEHDVKKSDEK